MFISKDTILDDKFEIRGTIGSGGMGVVYEAYQPAFDRLVALKLLTYAPSDNSEDYARFEREAMVLSRLAHPNIVRFFSYGFWQSYPYIAMERLPSNSLQQMLANHESGLPLSESLDIAIQIVSALQHAHEHGVFHRDIKPSNVIMTDDMQVKLIDFGLAKLTGVDGKQKLTQTGHALGSVMYMSPEQCVGQPVDGRTDIYGVGCLLFHCLTGQPPFVADNGVAVMFQHLNEPVTRSEGWNRLPPPARQVIGRCMAKKAQHRYANAAELEADLKKLRAGQGDQIHYAAPQDSLLSPATAAGTGSKSFRRIAVMVLCAAVIGTAAIVSMQFLNKNDAGSGTTGDAASNTETQTEDKLRQEAATITSPQIALARGNRLMGNNQAAQAAIFFERANTLLENIGKDGAAKAKPNLRTYFHIKTSFSQALLGSGQFDRAYAVAQEAIELSKGLSKQDQATAFDFACASLIESGRVEEGVVIAKRAADAAEGALVEYGPGATSMAKRLAAYSWMRLAECQMRAGLYKEAEVAAQKGLQEGLTLPDTAVQLRALKTMGQVKFCLGDRKSAFDYMKQWQEIEATAAKNDARDEYPHQNTITRTELAYGRQFLGVLRKETGNQAAGQADENQAQKYADNVEANGSSEFAGKKLMEEAEIYYHLKKLKAGDETAALGLSLLQRGSRKEVVARAAARMNAARANAQ